MVAAEPLIEAKSITKSFGPKRVLQRASLACSAGEVVLLLGANGAGKSTLLRVMAGLSRPDGGQLTRPRAGSLGFLSHHLFLYSRLTARENLRLFGALSGVPGDSVAAALREWGLADVADRPVSELSRGNQARVGLARTFLNAPLVRLLDEPSANLDDSGVERLQRAILAGPRSATVIATHDLHRLGGLATRVVVMSQGEVLADSGAGGSTAEIAQAVRAYRELNR